MTVEDSTHAMVAAYMRRAGWARSLHGDTLDDLWAELLLTAVRARASWQPGAGRTLLTWTWLHLHRDAGRWWKRRQRWAAELPLADDTWLDPATHEAGYSQVEDRDQLQRLADRVRLTDEQANSLEWFAVHGHTPTHHLGGHARWWPGLPSSVRVSYGGALKKLRAAAA